MSFHNILLRSKVWQAFHCLKFKSFSYDFGVFQRAPEISQVFILFLTKDKKNLDKSGLFNTFKGHGKFCQIRKLYSNLQESTKL